MANVVPHGFTSLKDLFPTALTDHIPEVQTAIAQSVAEHNRQMEAILGLFCTKTTEKQLRYRYGVNTRLVAGDEYSEVDPVKGMSRYTVAWPLQIAQGATGVTYNAEQRMTVKDAEMLTGAMLSADFRWLRDHILAALFMDATWVHTNERDGDLTIQPLANGDSVVYQVFAGADAGAVDTHQHSDATAIGDAAADNPYIKIYAELMEHPENGGKVICLIPTALKATTIALTGFYDIADPNIRLGSGTAELIGGLGVQVPGTLIGYAHECWIVEWPSLPATHIIGVCTEGDRPLRMREEDIVSLQGFRHVIDTEEHPFYKSHFERTAGFGAWNRVGAVSSYIGNDTYAVPTNYTPPIP